MRARARGNERPKHSCTGREGLENRPSLQALAALDASASHFTHSLFPIGNLASPCEICSDGQLALWWQCQEQQMLFKISRQIVVLFCFP